MLYIFRNKGGVQIAWDSRAPLRSTESRIRQLDTRVSLPGLIRTWSAG